MKYRATILTPTLVGDGQALSPIDYMVWKDHVNVLDQTKIFALMARRPVFEGYLHSCAKLRSLTSRTGVDLHRALRCAAFLLRARLIRRSGIGHGPTIFLYLRL